MKIVLIGGGSYVFAPTVIKDIIIKHELEDSELVLVDLNQEAVELMEGVARKIAEDLGVNIEINSSVNRRSVFPETDFVIVSAAIQGIKRWQMDYEILSNLGIPHQARENGGLGGLSYSFRSISLLMDICRDMEELCPGAVLLNVTNPLPRVLTAVHNFTEIQAAGFCNIAWRSGDGYQWFADLLGKDKSEIEVTTAGLNHFAWLVDIKDKKTGKDLYAQVEKIIKEKNEGEFKIINKWLDQWGGIIAGVVGHHAEYLPYDEDIDYHISPPFHGDEEERKQRTNNLRDIINGKKKWEEVEVFQSGSWEHPAEVAVALGKKKDQKFDMLNLPNQNYIKGIPNKRIVEVPARTEDGKIKGIKVEAKLSAGVIDICNTISEVHETVAEAAVKGDRELAQKAIAIDPAIQDKEKGYKALDKMLEVHKDILPQFGNGDEK